jgi:hypothetical protein
MQRSLQMGEDFARRSHDRVINIQILAEIMVNHHATPVKQASFLLDELFACGMSAVSICGNSDQF